MPFCLLATITMTIVVARRVALIGFIVQLSCRPDLRDEAGKSDGARRLFGKISNGLTCKCVRQCQGCRRLQAVYCNAIFLITVNEAYVTCRLCEHRARSPGCGVCVYMLLLNRKLQQCRRLCRAQRRSVRSDSGSAAALVLSGGLRRDLHCM